MTNVTSSKFTLTLPSDTEILITREFSAPRRLVFEAMTRPEHVTRWWGPRSMKLILCEMDVRVGGGYRFVLRGPDGNDFGFRGVYREIVPPERVVSTFEFEGMPGHESVETLTLVETAGKTILTCRCLYQSVEDRDGHLHSGMENGTRESHDRLEALIATLA
ncbi:MAG: SRPBCC family protein [Planctomycetales bacterium]